MAYLSIVAKVIIFGSRCFRELKISVVILGMVGIGYSELAIIYNYNESFNDLF